MWLRNSRGDRAKSRCSSNKRPGLLPNRCARARRLQFEPLEQRAMLADYTVSAAGPGGNGLDNAVADAFRLVLDSSHTSVKVYLNGTLSQTLALNGMGKITIQGSNDNDTLTVDQSNGLVSLPNGIVFSGGSGTNSLILSGGSTNLNETYDGAAGTDLITDASHNVQTVSFTGIGSTLSTAPATSFVVLGTTAADTIEYTQGSSAATGKVSIGGYAAIEFSGKTSLNIVGGAGADTITLNNPTTPTGLANILVNGATVNQSPTLNDVGNPASIDINAGQQSVSLTGIGDGDGGAQALQVTVSGDNATLIPSPTVSYTSPASSGSINYTPAANQSGTAHLTVTVRDAGLDGTLGNSDDLSISKSFLVVVTLRTPPVAGPVLWLDASTLNLTNGAAVTGLTDWSASHNNALASGSPTFNAGGLRGLGTIHLVGAQSLTTASNIGIAGDESRSVFVVMRRNSSGSERLPVQLGNDVSNQGWGITSQTDGLWTPYTNDNGGISTETARPADSYELYDAMHQIFIPDEGAVNYGYVDGSHHWKRVYNNPDT